MQPLPDNLVHLPEPNRVIERLALRGLALVLAPVAFAGVLAVALASLPAAAFRGFLGR
jgi:hypothetical protein